MYIRRQDIFVLLFYYLGYSRIRNLFLRIQRKPVARFVVFHDVPSDALGPFVAKLRFFKRFTNVVSLDDFFAARLSTEKINVVITFDDGFKSWVSHAVPLLKELGLPATFFVSSGFIGLTRDREAEFIRSRLFPKLCTALKVSGALSAEDVRRIAEEGFTVGGHTLNHCNLAELKDIVQLRYEISEDRVRLERLTGGNVQYFSYPFGVSHNSEIDLASMLEESGYRGAVTNISGFNSIGMSPYALHREITDVSMHERVFRARVYGNYDAVSFLKQQLRMARRQRTHVTGACNKDL